MTNEVSLIIEMDFSPHYHIMTEAKSVIDTYVTSCIDQNNCLLLGIQKKLKCLQYAQNASVKRIVGAKKTAHTYNTNCLSSLIAP